MATHSADRTRCCIVLLLLLHCDMSAAVLEQQLVHIVVCHCSRKASSMCGGLQYLF